MKEKKNKTLTKFGNSEFADKPTNYYNLDKIYIIVSRKNQLTFYI